MKNFSLLILRVFILTVLFFGLSSSLLAEIDPNNYQVGMTPEQSHQYFRDQGDGVAFRRLPFEEQMAYYRSIGAEITTIPDDTPTIIIEGTEVEFDQGSSFNSDPNYFDDTQGVIDDSDIDHYTISPEKRDDLLNQISNQTIEDQERLGSNTGIQNYNNLTPQAQQDLANRYGVNQAEFNDATQARRDQIINQYIQDTASRQPLGPASTSINFTGSKKTANNIKFVPLEGTGIQGLTDVETGNSLPALLNAGYQLLIGIASVLAVVMIFYAGFRYATTTSGGAKTDAKNRILAALGGLLLALSSWLILTTIDADLVGVELAFQGFEEGVIRLSLQTEDGREALRRAYQPTIVANPGGSILNQGLNGASGTIGGIATGGMVTFPSGEQFQAVEGGVIDGIDYTDGGGGNFARGVALLDTQGKRDKYLSKNFQVKNFTTHDGARYARISPRAIQGLQSIRDRAGIALTITSGYRHPSYNASKTKTGRTGPHTGGHAIDIGKPSGMSYEQLARLVIDEFGCKIGLGMGGGMVHFDFRGVHQSWAYRGYTNSQVDNFYDDYCKGKY